MRLACFSGYTCLVPFTIISVASSCLFLLFVSQYSTPLNKLEIFKKVRCVSSYIVIYHILTIIYPNNDQNRIKTSSLFIAFVIFFPCRMYHLHYTQCSSHTPALFLFSLLSHFFPFLHHTKEKHNIYNVSTTRINTNNISFQ